MTDYSTAAEIRAHLRIGSQEFADATLTAMISEATARIDRLTGRTWQGNQTVTDKYYTGDGFNRLQLDHVDNIVVTSLGINQNATGSTYTSVTTSRVRAYSELGLLELQPNAEVVYFPEYLNSIKISYTYGNATIPNDIKLACRYLVAYKVKVDESVNEEFYEIMNAFKIHRFKIV